ncbi:MAG TPA: D-aminoacyl-tRNA deacylase [Syntrophomonadaceae bacterium]|nr:D-aminoacyl-tRNA deacylase [Syntrophomonadaceae bacterium]
MRAIVQRTLESSIVIDNIKTAEIEQGLIVFIGIKTGDNQKDAQYLMEKIINLRIFEDSNGKMNLSLIDIKGELLLVSQFTLYGDTRKGRRPSFSSAESPEVAEPLFNYCVDYVRQHGIKTKTGAFGADMKINIVNDGPCTILIDSEKVF